MYQSIVFPSKIHLALLCSVALAGYIMKDVTIELLLLNSISGGRKNVV